MRPPWRRRPADRVGEPRADAHHAVVDRRRALALSVVGTGTPAAARVSGAPAGYVLAHTTSDVVRHGELLDPLPAPGEVRVVVTPARRAGYWHLDVATRDQPGLLAAFSGVLAGVAIEVAQAVIATWADGAALQAFTVKAADLPDVGALQTALTASLAEPLWSLAVPDASVIFDADASALFTSCEIIAPDRPGLLHSLTAAIAAAGADIHGASVATVGGIAHDRFDLSDTDGHKIGADLEARILECLESGTRPLTRS